MGGALLHLDTISLITLVLGGWQLAWFQAIKMHYQSFPWIHFGLVRFNI